MKTILLLAVIAFTGITLRAQCEPVSTLDEDFNDFVALAGLDFPQNCWNGDMDVKESDTPGDNYLEYFSAMIQNRPLHLISPELAAINNQYMLSFDAYKLDNNPHQLIVQVATCSQQDGTGYLAFGDPILITMSPTTYNVVITTGETQKFIYLLLSGNATHMTASIDNVKYLPVADVKNFDKALFSIYPNPSADKNITIQSNFTAKAIISIYTMTGVSVYAKELDNSDIQNLDLSSLPTGIYIVKVTSGAISESKKLIMQ